jgi:hypothetical protein
MQPQHNRCASGQQLHVVAAFSVLTSAFARAAAEAVALLSVHSSAYHSQ